MTGIIIIIIPGPKGRRVKVCKTSLKYGNKGR